MVEEQTEVTTGMDHLSGQSVGNESMFFEEKH
jgi:hypothetical protein